MKTAFVICLFFATRVQLNAETIADSSNDTVISTFSNTTTPFLVYNLEQDLAEIAAACKENNTETDYSLFGLLINSSTRDFILAAQNKIGIAEMRDVLGLPTKAPPCDSQKAQCWKPGAYKYAAANITVEEYLNLWQANSILNNIAVREKHGFFFKFWDEHYPQIGEIYRNKFEEVLRVYGEGRRDKKLVDRLIEELESIDKRVDQALDEDIYKCT